MEGEATQIGDVDGRCSIGRKDAQEQKDVQGGIGGNGLQRKVIGRNIMRKIIQIQSVDWKIIPNVPQQHINKISVI